VYGRRYAFLEKDNGTKVMHPVFLFVKRMYNLYGLELCKRARLVPEEIAHQLKKRVDYVGFVRLQRRLSVSACVRIHATHAQNI
jgi:hypothetical protein